MRHAVVLGILGALVSSANAAAATTVTMLGRGTPTGLAAEPGGDVRVDIDTWRSLREVRVPAAGALVSATLIPAPQCLGGCSVVPTAGGGTVYAHDVRSARRSTVQVTSRAPSGAETTQTLSDRHDGVGLVGDIAASPSGATAVELSLHAHGREENRRWMLRGVGATGFAARGDETGFTDVVYNDAGDGAFVTVRYERREPQLLVRRIARDATVGSRVLLERRGRNVLDARAVVAPDGSIGVEWLVAASLRVGTTWDLMWSTLAPGARTATTTRLWRGRLLRYPEDGPFEMLSVRRIADRWLLAAAVDVGAQPTVQVREATPAASPSLVASYPVSASANAISLAASGTGAGDVVWNDWNEDAGTGSIVRGHRDAASGRWSAAPQTLWTDEQALTIGCVSGRPDGGLAVAYDAGSITATFLLRTDD